ncbi:MAG: hypothetical protein OXG17_00895 [Chloroflexi bacterium]|nr:hypothetical protein [Chloroflexota bacterium]
MTARQQQRGVRVPQVVEPRGSWESRPLECRPHPAVHRTHLQRLAHRIRQNQIMVGIARAQSLPLPVLPRALLPQGGESKWSQIHDSRLMGLGRSEDESAALHRREAPAHNHKAAVKVNIRPLKPQQFTAAEPAQHGQHQQRVDRLRRVRREQALERRLVEDGDCALRDPRQFDGVRRVARHQPPSDRLGERLVNDRMNQVHRGRGKALLDGRVAEVLDIGRGDPAHRKVPGLGDDVASHDARVPGMRARSLVQPDMRQPALVQVPAQ